ncbi:GDP-mannose 4,6-dehydratase [Halomonas sp. CUBES01]|uniref:GDP-mannose 4,6-dehydratase n=1 Tax=Vreelandella gomseomensis TaxID=370766 RepID=A0ABU1GEV7_9GAMM|nr:MULTISPECIES: GDP-mannose 4,6-dehydratase [Halomonas]MDR5876005.1 GDP-mannose 4,6-dehydratase [Halomonas gomseomensis]MEC4766700.1 GDP-mannose 4,6-dehydratase [Halomonas sp. CUBES01]
MQRILVTGASGFVGHHLLAALHEAWPDARLHATVSRQGTTGRGGVASPRTTQWHSLDVRDASQVNELINRLKPQAIIHLAAQSHVPTSFEHTRYTWDVNLQGTLNILDSIQRECPDALLLNVGSSDMYGAAFRHGHKVSEDTAFEPLNPYAASKASADLAVGQTAASQSLRAVRARPFNHTGPGQRDAFVLASFATQIARIEQGKQSPVLETGDLTAERDFIDVQDVCQAYIELLSLPEEGQRGQAYNIASGRSMAIGELLQKLLSLSSVAIEHRLDPARQRPSDIPVVQASTEAIHAATRWQPSISCETMLSRLLDDCRQRQRQTP